MTITQRNRLINTAIMLLENTDHDGMVHMKDGMVFQFDMSMFARSDDDEEIDKPYQIHDCGTSCCVVGLGAAMYPEKIDLDTRWSEVSRLLYGINSALLDDNDDPDEPVYDSKTWDFLFSYKNPSDPIDVANRVHHILDGGDPAYAYSQEKNGVKLVEKLKLLLA